LDLVYYGKVLSESGKPIKGCRVSIGEVAGEPLRGVTNGYGHFVIGGLKKGTHYVTADATGYAIKMGRVELTEDKARTIILERFEL